MKKGEKEITMQQQFPRDNYIKAGEVNTRYWALGDQGSPVILIHGLGASADIWQKNVETLSKHHRVYVPDLVGFGRSDKPDIEYTPSSAARFIYDFMNALNIEKATLMGYSLGGGISLQFSLEYPDKVDKIVLVDSAGLGSKVIFPLRLLSLPFIGKLMTRPSRKGVYLYFRDAVYDRKLLNEDFIDLYYELHSLPGAQESLLRVIRTAIGIRGAREKLVAPIMNNLEKINQPTLIVWGKQDKVIPLEHAYFAKERIPNSQLHVFDPCGHMPQFERPEEFNNLVLEFL